MWHAGRLGMDLARFLVEQHRRQRPPRRRISVVGWIFRISMGLGVVIVAMVVLLAYLDAQRPGCGRTPSAARFGAIQMAAAIDRYRLEQDDRCPDGVGDLKRAGILRHTDLGDPWGRPYVITCGVGWDVSRVCSRGRDAEDPADDVCSDDLPAAAQYPLAR